MFHQTTLDVALQRVAQSERRAALRALHGRVKAGRRQERAYAGAAVPVACCAPAAAACCA